MIVKKGQLTATQPQARRPGVHDVMHSKNTFASGSQLLKTVDIVRSISCLIKRTGGNFEDD
jgi:hypothetical protein